MKGDSNLSLFFVVVDSAFRSSLGHCFIHMEVPLGKKNNSGKSSQTFIFADLACYTPGDSENKGGINKSLSCMYDCLEILQEKGEINVGSSKICKFLRVNYNFSLGQI